MDSVTSIAKGIVAREGGYVNDPDDPGGATKFGVTIHSMHRLGLDLDRVDDVDARDVKLLTYDHAAGDHYFRGNASHAVPECFAADVGSHN